MLQNSIIEYHFFQGIQGGSLEKDKFAPEGQYVNRTKKNIKSSVLQRSTMCKKNALCDFKLCPTILILLFPFFNSQHTS